MIDVFKKNLPFKKFLSEFEGEIILSNSRVSLSDGDGEIWSLESDEIELDSVISEAEDFLISEDKNLYRVEKITINLMEFIKTAKFAGITLDSRRQEVIDKLGYPDSFYYSSYNSNIKNDASEADIWMYGPFEMFFNQHKISCIQSKDMHGLHFEHEGRHIKVKTFFSCNCDMPTSKQLNQYLDKENIKYKNQISDSEHPSQDYRTLTSSGVWFYYDAYDEVCDFSEMKPTSIVLGEAIGSYSDL